MLSDWWNGVELWVLGLAFPLQFALVVAVLVPLCLVVAWLIDRIVDHASAVFGPAHSAVPPIGSHPLDDDPAPAESTESAEATGSAAADEVAEVSEVAEVAEPETPAPDERVPAESTGRARS
jgi:hypothetical protein